MTTHTTLHSSNLSSDLRQLVLFPEVVGVHSLPLDQCHVEVSSPVRAQDEGPLSIQQALDARQLLLFADTM